MEISRATQMWKSRGETRELEMHIDWELSTEHKDNEIFLCFFSKDKREGGQNSPQKMCRLGKREEKLIINYERKKETKRKGLQKEQQGQDSLLQQEVGRW